MLRVVGVVLLPLILAGCGTVILDPSGDVAVQQRNLIIASTLLMLLIIVPVIALTLIFARRYRAENTQAVYDPEWHHSTQLEVVIWTAPLLIIIALGAITWLATHTLDPYRPLTRLDGSQPVPPGVKPLDVQVVALDWKWLFFYPDQGIATVNELAAPVNVPIAFKITSATVMNSFFIPAMA
jgi:cytochrome o ubiquinol oxidase subunit II